MLCSYGKYYRFEDNGNRLDFQIYYYVFNVAQELQKSRAVSHGMIEGAFDERLGAITGLRIHPNCDDRVIVEKRSSPCISVEGGKMLETVASDGSHWRKGQVGGQAWPRDLERGYFTWSVPVLLCRGAKIPLDHVCPDSFEGKYVVRKNVE